MWKYKIKKRPFDREHTSVCTYRDDELPELITEYAAKGYCSVLFYRVNTNAAHIPPRSETTGSSTFDVAGAYTRDGVSGKFHGGLVSA